MPQDDKDDKGMMQEPKLGSKEGSNRDGGRGASQDVVGGATLQPQRGYSFYGAPDGSNNDTQSHPEVKTPSKPTLGDY